MSGLPAATWGDLIVGVDFHTVLVPSPAGPVPALLPHPFVGLTGDPVAAAIDALMVTGMSLLMGGGLAPPPGPVLVNGRPVLTVDDLSHNTLLLPHFPMPPGASFASPPSGDATHKLGSMTVTARGGSIVRMGELVFSCSEIKVPSSTVIVLPKGAPVLTGGPPGINLDEALDRYLLGKAFRTAWKGVSAGARFLARHSAKRLRTWVAKAACFFTGHPVDVVSGCVVTDAVDFSMGGAVPLMFERSYSSGWAARSGSLGHGWSHNFDRAVWYEEDGIVAKLSDGREIVFEAPATNPTNIRVGQQIFEPLTGYTLTCLPRGGWRLESPEGVVDDFALIDNDPSAGIEGRIGLARLVRTGPRDRAIGIQLSYDARARLTKIEGAGGRAAVLTYDIADRIVEIGLPHPDEPDHWQTHVRYRYSDAGDLVQVKDACGSATEYEYGGQHLMTEEKRRNGVTFFWQYDGVSPRAKCVETWGEDADGAGMYHHLLWYNGPGRKTVVANSYGKKTEYSHNELGLVTAVKDPIGAITRYDYTATMRRCRTTDQLGNVVQSTTFDERGQAIATQFADGASTRLSRDERFPELVQSCIDLNGNSWAFRHDAAGNLTETNGPHPDAKEVQVWQAGLLSAIERTGGRKTDLDYSRAGDLTAIRYPDGAVDQFTYDRRGRARAHVLPSGGRREFSYDAADRVVRLVEATGDVTDFLYDGEGNITEERTAVGSRKFSYANFDKIAAVLEGGEQERFEWGMEGELLAVENGKGERQNYVYDLSTLNPIELIDFDRSKVRYAYDRAGRCTRRTTPVGSIDFKYDAAGRIVGKSYSDGIVELFVYCADGAVMEASHSQTGSVRFERDELGRVVREQQGQHWVSRTYAFGDLVGMESSLGARMAVSRSTNGTPRGYTLGPPLGPQSQIQIESDPNETFERRTLPGDVVVERGNDIAGRPVFLNVRPGPGEPWSQSLVWGPAERLSSRKDSRFGRSTFSHDARGNLIAERLGNDLTYRLPDAAGNIFKTADGSDRDYATGGRLRRDGEERFTYRADGCLTARWSDARTKTWGYDWDVAGRLVGVDRPDGARVTFEYDALGRRIGKRVGKNQTTFVWDGDVLLHEISTGTLSTENGVLTWYHEPWSFTPLARFESDSKGAVTDRSHLVVDHLGTPTALYGVDGVSGLQIQLDIYGLARFKPDPDTLESCPIRWPGQYAEDSVGLIYNRFRWYAPTLGTYISKDPIGILGGLALYAYVPDPLVWLDAVGLSAVTELPPFKGRPHSWLRKRLYEAGFHRAQISSSGNEKWKHSDGSEVLIHPYGNQQTAIWKTANNAHVHKNDPVLGRLNDRGIATSIDADVHIGISNPRDLPARRGRQHGCGSQ